ncbi:hypothetical protein [Blastococcus sp. CCUG 61487]|uniref:hypothetical protein n=1 Tax=Blastococcus sp. CCUG 61487 TaxID=1840703 RepID=UPI0010BFF081|nr:hypothetical protein [Blastococcus sp. CCUG 61487]TKJ25208.1 hypothetical protein A6V29_04085 [Blastococcus sp. CCUG 61487]
MRAVGPVAAAAVDSSSVPTLIVIALALLGGGGVAALVTALATRRNYVQTGFRDLADASAKEAAEERAERQRIERSRDRWRAYSYALRDELAAAGLTSKAIPPVDHPSEAS